MIAFRSLTILLAFSFVSYLMFSSERGTAADSETAADSGAAADPGVKATKPPEAATKEPAKSPDDKLVPLNKQGTVLLDLPGKRLLLKSKVVLRKGLLELLCCLKQSKEHESILSVDSKAYVVHTGLLALKAEVGRPVAFQPEYRAPTGEEIDIFLSWTDENGKKHRVPGQTWVRSVVNRYYAEELAKLPETVKISKDRELRYDKSEKELIWYGQMTEKDRGEMLKMSDDPAFQKAIKSMFKRSQPAQMDARWVFAGSGFFIDETTGDKYYRAEDGDLICVANFASATLDVSVKSAAGNEELLYEAYTEQIPAIGTDVMIELIPVFKDQDEKPKTEKPE